MSVAASVALLLGASLLQGAAAQSDDGFDGFTSSDITGALLNPDTKQPDGTNGGDYFPQDASTQEIADRVTDGTVITLQQFSKKGNLWHACGCYNEEFDFTMDDAQQFRSMSDRYVASGRYPNRFGWSNLLWSWGQFIDHDVVATVDDEHSDAFPIELNSYGQSATMTLHRLLVEEGTGGNPQCRSPITVISPQVDGGMVYGSDEAYLKEILREPTGCRLRTSAGDLLPVTTGKDSAGKNRLIAGDARVNEHAMLASMHTLWVREHNRLCDGLDGDESMTDDEKFALVRKVVAGKIQQITVRDFLPLLGISEAELRSYTPKVDKADMTVEFMIAYRMGHDLIPDNLGRYGLASIFDGEKFFGIDSARGAGNPDKANEDMDRLFSEAASSLANDMDGRFSDALRHTLFGSFGEDLATRNMFRGMEVGMVGYSKLAKCFGVPPVLRYEGAMNDIPTLMLLQDNAYNRRDALGPVNKAILLDQFHRSIFGAQGAWWGKHADELAAYADEIESCSLAKVIQANTKATVGADAFKA